MGGQRVDEVAHLLVQIRRLAKRLGDVVSHERSKSRPQPMNGDFHRPLADVQLLRDLGLRRHSSAGRDPRPKGRELIGVPGDFALLLEREQRPLDNRQCPLPIEIRIARRLAEIGRVVRLAERNRHHPPAAAFPPGVAPLVE